MESETSLHEYEAALRQAHSAPSVGSVRRIRSILLVVGVLAGCKTEGRVARNDPVATQPEVSVPLPTKDVADFVGDTLELFSIGGRRLPDPGSVNLPCDSAFTPRLERHVFLNDSMYSGTIVLRPGCAFQRGSSSDTLIISSIYRVHGDTLTLYTGDGDEIFQSYNGLIFPDSVVQISIEDKRNWRYLRRRARSHSDK